MRWWRRAGGLAVACAVLAGVATSTRGTTPAEVRALLARSVEGGASARERALAERALGAARRAQLRGDDEAASTLLGVALALASPGVSARAAEAASLEEAIALARDVVASPGAAAHETGRPPAVRARLDPGAGLPARDELRPEPAATSPRTAPPLVGRALYEARLPAIVQVRTRGRLGSGVVVAPELVLTNAHVLGAGEGHVSTATGERVAFSRSLKHPFADVAVIRVPGLRADPAPVGSGIALRPGDPVSLIGSPRGLSFSYSDGVVSAVARTLDDSDAEMIQFTAPISQGSSGAPLFDGEGRLAALASLFFEDGQALNFAVPVEYGLDLIRTARLP